MTSDSVPALASIPRITTLVASLLVALSSGTNYVYSAYAPQLGSRLRITHTQLNIVALAGNVGVYSSGPVWGRIVDTRGPRILLVGAFLFLLTGYSGIRRFFDNGLAEGVSTLPSLSFYVLVACSYLTGAGGNGGLTSAVNSTARTFPDQLRASTTGLVISGFGLSAFLFSTLAHLFFAGNTSEFILLLALGTSFPMIMGFFLVRPIPLPSSSRNAPNAERRNSNTRVSGEVDASDDDGSRSRLLDHDDLGDGVQYAAGSASGLVEHNRDMAAVELGFSTPDRSSSGLPPLHVRSQSRDDDGLPNIFGRRLWTSSDFWLLFTILSLLSGTGLMYINNVGSMSQALFAHKNPAYDEVKAAQWQAAQVSSISLMNFSGRIIIGLISDYAKTRLSLPRSYCLVIVACSFFISQLAAANINKVEHLWVASALLGLSHGSVFSLFPTVCIEWFGMPHFSENWGYLSMSPMFAGNLFSLIFGRNLDAHESAPSNAPSLIASPSLSPSSSIARLSSRLSVLPSRAEEVSLTAGPQCLQGLECYVGTLRVTIVATFLSILLSIWAGWRDRKRISEREGRSFARRKSISAEELSS